MSTDQIHPSSVGAHVEMGFTLIQGGINVQIRPDYNIIKLIRHVASVNYQNYQFSLTEFNQTVGYDTLGHWVKLKLKGYTTL